MTRMQPLTAFRDRSWITNLILLVLGCALLAFTRQLIAEFHHFTIGFSGVAGWSVILYALSILVILTQPSNRFTLPLIIGFAIAFRVVTLFPAPEMSSDIYRYAWDGVVQHAHISPYRYVPGDPALSFLRASHMDLFEHINRRDYAHTIYPPFAQFLFYVITAFNASVTCMKLAMILFEGLTLYALMQLLLSFGRRREEVLLYAWCPLLIWEIGSSGHLDSAAMAFIALALLARLKQRTVLTGLSLGAAVLIKFYPLLLLPALWQRKEFKMPLALAAFIAFFYACYSSVGWHVFGFLGGYTKEEGLQSGARYFLLQIFREIPGMQKTSVSIFLFIVAVPLGALALWCWKTSDRPPGETQPTFWTRIFHLPANAAFLPPAMFLSLALMLIFSPHYPWYVAWLIPFFVLLPNLPVFAYTLGLFYLCSTPLGAGTPQTEFHLNCILYPIVVFAAILDWPFRAWYLRKVTAQRILP